MFRSGTIRVGAAPIVWSNDDRPDLGSHISFEQCVDEIAEAGYEGCEVNHKFPTNVAILKPALAQRKLQLASAWFSTHFTNETRVAETIAQFKDHMHFLKSMGSKVIVVCECNRAIHGENTPISESPSALTDKEWQDLISGLHHIGKLAQENGMDIVYHHHMGTVIQSQDQVNRLMEKTDSSLLLDTGHLEFDGGDSTLMIKDHGHRIKHVHFKDLRQDEFARVSAQRWSFLEGVCEGVFTVPGQGLIKFEPVLNHLADIAYEGWIIVEAEQDPQKAHPLHYAQMGRQYLKEIAGI